MDRAEKTEMVESLNGIFKTSGSVVVARYKGMTVAQMSDLRRHMGGAGANSKSSRTVSPKLHLITRQMAQAADLFLEPTGIAFAQDPTAAAKVAADYAKTNDKFVIVGGMLGRQALDADGVKALAAIPSMEELRSKLLGVLLAPGSKLVRQLNSPAQSLLRACCKPTRKSKKRRDGSRQSLQSPTNHHNSRGLNVRET